VAARLRSRRLRRKNSLDLLKRNGQGSVADSITATLCCRCRRFRPTASLNPVRSKSASPRPDSSRIARTAGAGLLKTNRLIPSTPPRTSLRPREGRPFTNRQNAVSCSAPAGFFFAAAFFFLGSSTSSPLRFRLTGRPH
jgi:hypothetical protein